MRRALGWIMLALPAALSPALADEASNLLGRAPISSAVRKVIDDQAVKPTAPAGKGPGIGAASSDDDDLPAGTGIPSLEKLQLQKLRIMGGGPSDAGSELRAAVPSPLDIHGGRLEAQSSGTVAESIDAKLNQAAVPHSGAEVSVPGTAALNVPGTSNVPGIPAANAGSLADTVAARLGNTGAAAGNPVIKPSGFHVLDVVNEMQKPAQPGTPQLDSVLQALRQVNAAGGDPNVPLPAAHRIPDNPAERLKEVQARLDDIGRILPDGPRAIVDNVNKVIDPGFVTSIADKAKTGDPDVSNALAKLTEISIGQPAAPATDTPGVPGMPGMPGMPGSQDVPGIPSPRLPSAQDNMPDAPGGIEPNLKALAELQRIPGKDPAANFDDIIAALRDRARDPSDPDTPRWAALLDKLEDLGGTNVPMKALEDVQALLKQPAADPSVPGTGEAKTSVSVSDRIDQIAQRVDKDVSPIRARIDTSLSTATKGLQGAVNAALSAVSDKINDGLDKAFSQLKSVCQTEAAKHASSAADYQSKADGTKVPDIQYVDCQCRRCGDCVWLWECCCARCPTSDSIKANADATAQKSALEAQAKAEKDQADKFNQAADQVMQKKNEIETNLATIFAGANAQVANIDLAGGGVADSGDDDGGSSASAPRSLHPHGTSLVDNTVMLDRFLSLLGDTAHTVQVSGAVNAAVGMNSSVEQRLASLGGGLGGKTIGGLVDTDISAGAVNAAIGYNSAARQVAASVGTVDANQNLGAISATRTVAAPINAAIGAGTFADMRIASLGGSAPAGVRMTSTVAAPVNAAIGYASTAVMEVGNIDGAATGTASSTSTSAAPVNAALGAHTTSMVRIGNFGSTGSIAGSYSSTVTQPAGTVAAAIGYQSATLVGVGNIDGNVGGNTSVNIVTGPAVAAAIGGSTTAVNRVGELSRDVRIGSSLNITANTGLLTAFALGANTTARNEVAVIDSPVSGSASISVNAGEIITGTVGANTAANATIGSIKAPVYGNASIAVNAGGINTFAIGLSTGDTINSQTFVGSVLSPVNGPVNISVTTGAIFTLGFGLDLGFLNFSRQGCTNIGNRGTGC